MDQEPVGYEEGHELAKQLARTLARRYPPVELQDIEQELALYLWKRKDRMLSKGLRWINFELMRKGGEWCRKQRAQQLQVDDQYHYLPVDLDRALEVFFDSEDWYKFRGPMDDKGYGGDVPDDGLNGIIMLLDMQRVWDHLKANNQQALYYVYGLGMSVENYALECELELEAARKRLARARVELLEWLNGQHAAREFVGKRKVVPNFTAQEMTRMDYVA